MAQDIEDRLVQAIQKQVEKVNYYCSAEYVLPDLAVHEIRKSFKRIRALLEFYPESFNEALNDYSKQIKSLAKLLSPVRESSVNVQLFDKLGTGTTPFPQQKYREVKDLLSEENKRIINELYADKRIFSEIKSFIYDIEARLFGILFHPSVRIDVLKQLSNSYKKGFHLYEEIKENYNPEKYHDLRKILKALGYQLDFAKVDQPRFFKLKSNALRKITEQLGADHDWHIFQSAIKQSVYGLEPSEIEVLDKQISLIQEPDLQKLFPGLKKFFKESPASFEEEIRLNYDPLV
jgi:hypothetical protein